MLKVSQIYEIRERVGRGESIKQIAKETNLSRNTIRKYVRNGELDPQKKKGEWQKTKLDDYKEELIKLLEERISTPKKYRKTIKAIYIILRESGFTGQYDTVRRFVNKWKEEKSSGLNKAFVPQIFRKGEAFQFDWSEQSVYIEDNPTKIYIVHICLCYSRMVFLRAYTKMTLEMVLDSHIKAHNFFGGLPKKGIYDNLKTVVTKINKGKDREFNKEFQKLASHYMFSIIACTPSSGWEKGRVERNVALIRNKIFTIKNRFDSIESINSLMMSYILSSSKTDKNPDYEEKTIYEMYEEEKSFLCKQEIDYDGYTQESRIVNSECIVNYDRNKYSVPCKYACKRVDVLVYADKIKFEYNGEVIAEHKRVFGRNIYQFNVDHYLDLAMRKPGCIRNGRPFVEMKKPPNLQKVWDSLIIEPGGDRKICNILSELRRHTIDELEEACSKSIASNIVSDTVIINYLNCLSNKDISHSIEVPDKLQKIKQIDFDLNIYNDLLNNYGEK